MACLPAMPPSRVRGNASRRNRATTTRMVPKGMAVVALWATATLFRMKNAMARGTAKEYAGQGAGGTSGQRDIRIRSQNVTNTGSNGTNANPEGYEEEGARTCGWGEGTLMGNGWEKNDVLTAERTHTHPQTHAHTYRHILCTHLER